MSIPAALASDFAWPSNVSGSELGPFYVNSAVYHVGLYLPASSTYLGVWKSSDPNTTAFTRQDTSNAPQLDSAAQDTNVVVSAWLSGSIIHIAVAGSGLDNVLVYHRYDTSSDSWTTSGSGIGTVLSAWGGEANPTTLYCSLRTHVISTTTYVQIAYNGGSEKVKGSTYERAFLATYNGSSWTTNRTWGYQATTEGSYKSWGLDKAAGVERIHGFVNGPSEVIVNTISTSDSVTIRAANTTSGAGGQPSAGRSYDDSGTVRMRHPLNISTGIVVYEYDDAASLGSLTYNPRSDAPAKTSAAYACMSIDGTDEYTFWIDGADDLAYDLNDGTDGELVDAATITRISCSPASYTVGGRNVIGVIYIDSGTEYYDELDLGGGTVQGSGTATGSADASATADVTHNADGTATGSADASATATVKWYNSGTATGSAEATATGGIKLQGSGTATGSADASGTATVTHNADATATGNGYASATATVTHNASATVTGSADASGTAMLIVRTDATATGSADASATATVTHNADATVTGSADAAATATVTHNADATVTGSAEATGTGRMIVGGSGTATGNAYTTALATVTHHAVAIAAGLAFVVALATVTHNASASVTGSADAAATATVTHNPTASATGTAYASGTADVTHNATATATGKAYASGTAVGETASATVTGNAYASGTPSVSHVGSGSCTGTAYATATADVTHRTSGTATGSADATGTASVTHGASATVTGAASASGTASVTHAGVGTATGTAYATATGTITITGSATATGSADASGTATVVHNAVGTATGQASVDAVGSVQGQTGEATVTGRAYASATATVEHDFSATATGRAYASGTLTAGDFSASATVTGRAYAWAGELPGYGYLAYLDDGLYFRLARYSPVTSGLEVIATVAYPHEPDTYYNIVLEADGNTIRAKVWSDAESEPTWMISETLTDYASGAPGLVALSTTEVLFDVFAAGIGGDTYPTGRLPQAVDWLLPVTPVYVSTEDPILTLAWSEAETTGDVLGGQIAYELEYRRDGDSAWTNFWRGYERTYDWNLSNLPAGSYCVRVRPYAGCEYGPWSELCGIDWGGAAPTFESPDGYYFGDDNVGQPDHGMWIRLFQASHKDDEYPVTSCLVSRELIPAGVGGECLFKKLYVTTTYTTQAEMQVTPILDGKVLTEEMRTIQLTPGAGGRTVDRFEIDLARNYESATAERFRYGMRGTYFQVKICVVDIGGTGRVEIDGVSLKYLVNRETHPWARPFAGELEVDVELEREGMYLVGTGTDDVPAALYELEGERDFGLSLSPIIQPRQIAPFGSSEEAWFRSLYLCITRSNTTDYELEVVPILDGAELTAEAITLSAVTQPKTEVVEIALSRPYERSDIEQSTYGLRGVWFSFRVRGTGNRPPGEVCFDGAAIEAIQCRETEATS